MIEPVWVDAGCRPASTYGSTAHAANAPSARPQAVEAECGAEYAGSRDAHGEVSASGRGSMVVVGCSEPKCWDGHVAHGCMHGGCERESDRERQRQGQQGWRTGTHMVRAKVSVWKGDTWADCSARHKKHMGEETHARAAAAAPGVLGARALQIAPPHRRPASCHSQPTALAASTNARGQPATRSLQTSIFFCGPT